MLKIITHSGQFHTDEVFAVALLMKIKNVIDIDLERTRESEILLKALSDPETYVIDVGQKYEPENRNFDHHQKGFSDTYPGCNVPLSSLGLVYKEFENDIFSEIPAELLDSVKSKFYNRYILPIDAVDNGVAEIEQRFGAKFLSKQIYSPIKLQHIVGSFNSDDVYDKEAQLSKFKIAVNIARAILGNWISDTIKKTIEWNENNEKVRSSVQPMQEIVVFDDRFSYHKALMAYEQEYNKTHWKKWNIKFIIIPDGDGQNWKIHTISTGKYTMRTPILYHEPKGNIVFVHRNRFVAVTKTRGSAIKLAKKSLDYQNYSKRKEVANILIGGGVVAYGLYKLMLIMKK